MTCAYVALVPMDVRTPIEGGFEGVRHTWISVTLRTVVIHHEARRHRAFMRPMPTFATDESIRARAGN